MDGQAGGAAQQVLQADLVAKGQVAFAADELLAHLAALQLALHLDAVIYPQEQLDLGLRGGQLQRRAADELLADEQVGVAFQQRVGAVVGQPGAAVNRLGQLGRADVIQARRQREARHGHLVRGAIRRHGRLAGDDVGDGCAAALHLGHGFFSLDRLQGLLAQHGHVGLHGRGGRLGRSGCHAAHHAGRFGLLHHRAGRRQRADVPGLQLRQGARQRGAGGGERQADVLPAFAGGLHHLSQVTHFQAGAALPAFQQPQVIQRPPSSVRYHVAQLNAQLASLGHFHFDGGGVALARAAAAQLLQLLGQFLQAALGGAALYHQGLHLVVQLLGPGAQPVEGGQLLLNAGFASRDGRGVDFGMRGQLVQRGAVLLGQLGLDIQLAHIVLQALDLFFQLAHLLGGGLAVIRALHLCA